MAFGLALATHLWLQPTWAPCPLQHSGPEAALCEEASAGDGKEGKGLGRKTALFGQAAWESSGGTRYGRVTFSLSGGDRVPWILPSQKEKRSQFPKIMRFQLSVILTLLSLAMAFETNTTHPAWQAPSSLLTHQGQEGLRAA